MTTTQVCPACNLAFVDAFVSKCPNCRMPLRFDTDEGELDLGVVLDSALNRTNDVHLFAENFVPAVSAVGPFQEETMESIDTNQRRLTFLRTSAQTAQVAQDVGIVLGVAGGLGLLAALNALLWGWVL